MMKVYKLNIWKKPYIMIYWWKNQGYFIQKRMKGTSIKHTVIQIGKISIWIAQDKQTMEDVNGVYAHG